jgi:hypothetical protein
MVGGNYHLSVCASQHVSTNATGHRAFVKRSKLALNVIAQLEIDGMRVEVGLYGSIGLAVLSNEMIHQVDGNDERQVSVTITLNQF